MASPEPVQSDLLPCDDVDWDQGLIGSNDPLFASTPGATNSGGSFATVCRAAHILGRVTRHRDDQILEFSYRLSEAVQLNRALLALDSTLRDSMVENALGQCDLSRALCYSARLMLYNIYACNDRYGDYRLSQETDMQKISIEGLTTVTLAVSRMAQRLKDAMAMNMGAINPLMTHCLYQALGECAWFVREDRSSEMRSAMDTIVDTLKSLRERWRVCGECLDFLIIWSTRN